jgi:PglZ domain
MLSPIADVHRGVVIVLDPHGLVEVGELVGDVAEIRDWWGLRAAYERTGRRRRSDAGPLCLVMSGGFAEEVLPWDIERASGAVVRVRLPGPPAVRAALSDLDGEEFDRAIRAVSGAADPAASILGAVTGVGVSSASLSRADQMRVAMRLAVRFQPSPSLLSLARRWVVDPILAGLLDDPPDVLMLQEDWARFAQRGQSSLAPDFQRSSTELNQLFAVGLLQPVLASADAPAWASAGVRQPTNNERAEKLLAEPPLPLPPSDAAGWATVGEWWGDLRRLSATAPPDLRQRAWDMWAELDAAFLPWLRERYGTVLTSSARWPPAVHRVADFLARRLRDGYAERILLIVLDGLGHAQWAHLRDRLPLQVLDDGSTFALVPTYTTVSRQAIFAGDLPVTFPNHLWTTRAEPRRWDAFWTAQGLPVGAAVHHRVKGRLAHDRVDFGKAQVIGVVVNAIDDLMHSSEFFGDAQLLANLDVWIADGFLLDLVRRASHAGIEVWVTADHGNLECLPAGAPSAGLAIEAAGKRLLRYPNRLLRDASSATGIVWDDIPGMPTSAEPLLFSPGRLAFTNDALSISHGGLSLDEAIVPLARVST